MPPLAWSTGDNFMSKIRLSLLVCFSFFLLSGPALVSAENVPSGHSQILGGIRNTGRVSELNRGAGERDLQTLIGQIIGTALSLIGLIFFILTVYGGFLWMTAHGEEGQIETGQNTIKAAVIGMIIIFSAYAITQLVLNSADSSVVNPNSPNNGGGAPENGGEPNGLACNDPKTLYVVDPADGTGLEVRQGPSVRSAGMFNMPNGTQFFVCGNAPQNGWGVIESNGSVGWVNLNPAWSSPV